MTDALLTIEEVADRCRTAISTVRWWIQTGRLQSRRPGRRRLVRVRDLDRFLDACASGGEGEARAAVGAR